jgi:hypothetical protein
MGTMMTFTLEEAQGLIFWDIRQICRIWLAPWDPAGRAPFARRLAEALWRTLFPTASEPKLVAQIP